MSFFSNLYSSLFGSGSTSTSDSTSSIQSILDEIDKTTIAQCNISPDIKVCDCPNCTKQLNKKNNGKLQIWYGTGNNGKTTLLTKLVSQVMSSGKSVRFINPSDLEDPLYDARVLEEDTGLFVISDAETPSEMDTLVRYFQGHGNKYVKHVVCTNFEVGLNENLKWIFDRVEVIKFDHIF